LVPAGAVVIAFGVGGEDKGEATVSAAKESEFAASGAAAMKTAMPVQIDGGPSMASEDFRFLLQKIPGALIWPGTRDEHKRLNDDE
jgi:metal-dependent amidase/aminoacylase/carboxypeptidase family protein